MMKGKIFLLTLLLVTASASFRGLYAEDKILIERERNVFVNPSDNEIMGKIGAGYAAGPDMLGLALASIIYITLTPILSWVLRRIFSG